MSTLLADRPPAASEQQPAAGSPGDPQPPPDTPAGVPTCANCGAPMDGTQDWCLQCGAGTSDSLRTRAPSWRSAAVILSVVAVLIAGAATAAYAALSKGGGKSASSTTIARVVPPAASTPGTSIPPPATPEVTTTPPPTVTGKVGTPTTIQPSTKLGTSKPPKIPLSAVTPNSGATVAPITPTQTNSTPTTKSNEGSAKAQQPILLDTNAAATYNPYGYPAANFGDPSLAIDGDTSTGWTAQVDPAAAPKMAEGLVIDLNTARKLSALTLTTSTPGMTVQVYGANGKTPPTSITDPAWAALSPSLLAKKKHVRIVFGGSSSASKQAASEAHRFVVLWISSAPASSVGTPQAPGHVSVNELELFPPKK